MDDVSGRLLVKLLSAAACWTTLSVCSKVLPTRRGGFALFRALLLLSALSVVEYFMNSVGMLNVPEFRPNNCVRISGFRNNNLVLLVFVNH